MNKASEIQRKDHLNFIKKMKPSVDDLLQDIKEDILDEMLNVYITANDTPAMIKGLDVMMEAIKVTEHPNKEAMTSIMNNIIDARHSLKTVLDLIEGLHKEERENEI